MSFIKHSAAACLFALASGAQAISVDVTSTKGITLGGAIGGAGGKFVPWGGSVVLDEKDALVRANGRCAFNVNYDMQNNGDSATAAFKNVLQWRDAVVAINSGLVLAAGQSRQISTQPYLAPGTSILSLRLDADNALAESNELNNTVAMTVTLNGTCQAGGLPLPSTPPVLTQADLSSPGGLAIGGRSVQWGGTVELSARDAVLLSNGQCVFAVGYGLTNMGNAAAGAFSNVLVTGNRVLSQVDGVILAAGQSRQVATQVYLAPGTNVLRLMVDMTRQVAESNETNNGGEVTVKVAACR